MKVHTTEFPGLLIVEPTVFADLRGYFFESFNYGTCNKSVINFKPVQDNESLSVKGVIRGLHFQKDPAAQAKLIRVIEGEIYDIALDLRIGSPTYGKWYGIYLDSESKKQFFIPKGFAHGFSVTSDKAIVLYKCDSYYSAQHEGGINVNDPDLKIDWKIPGETEIISDKDLKQPMFKDFISSFIFTV